MSNFLNTSSLEITGIGEVGRPGAVPEWDPGTEPPSRGLGMKPSKS